MNAELSNLGRNIYIALYDKKMTNSDLARKLGVSQQMVSDIVHGKKAPSAARLVQIANALDTTVDELIKT